MSRKKRKAKAKAKAPGKVRMYLASWAAPYGSGVETHNAQDAAAAEALCRADHPDALYVSVRESA